MMSRLLLSCLLAILCVFLAEGVPTRQYFAPPNNSFFPVKFPGKFQKTHSLLTPQSPNQEDHDKGFVSAFKMMKKIGSRPPNCADKCFGCRPCEAIQVPTTNTHTHVGVQYTNYEPEGWKCKCGHTFYTP